MVTKNQYANASRLINSGIYDIVTIRQATGMSKDEVEDLIDNYKQYTEMYKEPEPVETKSKWFTTFAKKLKGSND